MIWLVAIYLVVAFVLAAASAAMWERRLNDDEFLAFCVPLAWPLFVGLALIVGAIFVTVQGFLRLGRAINRYLARRAVVEDGDDLPVRETFDYRTPIVPRAPKSRSKLGQAI